MAWHILLISNSTLYGHGYLDHVENEIRDILGSARHVLFFPYALHDRDGYAAKAADRFAAMGYEMSSAHAESDPQKAVAKTDAIFVGGGNTFRLLKALQDLGWIEPIRKRVREGAPYIGSSAGSNVAGPTIKTTKDMPIVQPRSFDALGLVPFQISPHFQDPDPTSKHMGETQEERILQFLEENETPVLGMREGAWVRVENGSVLLKGSKGARIFRRGKIPMEAAPGDEISELVGAPMGNDGTLLLNRRAVDRLLGLGDCIKAVEEIFRLQGEGKVPPAGILGVDAPSGGLHVKAALLGGSKSYLVAKLNTNFPGNRTGPENLPTIQGLIVLCDGDNGIPLAVLDSIDITIKRTAAASAVAAKYLARRDSAILTICGCGSQARAQLSALEAVLSLEKIYAFDTREEAARNFAEVAGKELRGAIEPVSDLSSALRKSDVCITCTTAEHFFVRKRDVRPGTFIAAVGADNPHKQEIDPALMASAKVVTDSLEQSCAIGDTHHAIAHGLMRKEDVYAELGEIVAGRKPGRVSGEEIIVFDSTGIAFEDAVAAVMVYKQAMRVNNRSRFDFAA